MTMIRVLLARSSAWSFGGQLVRLGTMSNRNHVAIQVDQDVYEAQFIHGVVRGSVAKFEAHWELKEVFAVDLPDPDRVHDFCLHQLGKKYDWRGIVAMPARTNWQATDSWFCSELVAAALLAGGMKMWLPANRVTPRDLLVALGSHPMATHVHDYPYGCWRHGG